MLLFELQILQLYQISCIHHGLMMVGPSGSGKSSAWRVLLKALERLEGTEGVSHVINPKVMDSFRFCLDLLYSISLCAADVDVDNL